MLSFGTGETKRITGLMRLVQAGVIVINYATVAVEMLKDNASPKASPLYGAFDMPFAVWLDNLQEQSSDVEPPPTNSPSRQLFTPLWTLKIEDGECEFILNSATRG